jgi:hypothetical protein
VSDAIVQLLPIVLASLIKHSSIADFTDDLERLRIHENPITKGSLADIYRATKSDGVQIAVKCLRQYDGTHLSVSNGSFSWTEHCSDDNDYIGHCSGAQRVVEVGSSLHNRVIRAGNVPRFSRHSFALDGVWRCSFCHQEMADARSLHDGKYSIAERLPENYPYTGTPSLSANIL